MKAAGVELREVLSTMNIDEKVLDRGQQMALLSDAHVQVGEVAAKPRAPVEFGKNDHVSAPVGRFADLQMTSWSAVLCSLVMTASQRGSDTPGSDREKGTASPRRQIFYCLPLSSPMPERSCGKLSTTEHSF